MDWRLVPAGLVFLSAPLGAQESAPDADPTGSARQEQSAPEPAFQAISVDNPQFTSEKVGLIEHECDELAAWFAAYAGNELSAQTLKGDATSRRLVRRLLAMSFHLHPQNRSATRVNEALAEGKLPPILHLEDLVKDFAGKLHSFAVRLRRSGKPREIILAGAFDTLAADFDPTNEDAVYEAEVFEASRQGKPSLWKVLIKGKRDVEQEAATPASESKSGPAENPKSATPKG